MSLDLRLLSRVDEEVAGEHRSIAVPFLPVVTDLVVDVGEFECARCGVDPAAVSDLAWGVSDIGLIRYNADDQGLDDLESGQGVSMRLLSRDHDIATIEELGDVSSVVLRDQEFAARVDPLVTV